MRICVMFSSKHLIEYSALVEHLRRLKLNSVVGENLTPLSLQTVHHRRRSCTLTLAIIDGIIKVLLAVTEDRATLRSDLSAVDGV